MSYDSSPSARRCWRSRPVRARRSRAPGRSSSITPGAESNTCVGLARLGFRVAWVSRLGDDPPGDRIARGARGGRRRYALRAPRPAAADGGDVQGPASAQRVRYYRAGSAASALGPDDLEGVPVAEARAVLVTGVTALVGPGPQAAALALLGAARGLRVVDPNLRRGLPGSDRYAELVLPLVERADLVLAGEQELAELSVRATPRAWPAAAPRAARARSWCGGPTGWARSRPRASGSSWTSTAATPWMRWARATHSMPATSPCACAAARARRPARRDSLRNGGGHEPRRHRRLSDAASTLVETTQSTGGQAMTRKQERFSVLLAWSLVGFLSPVVAHAQVTTADLVGTDPGTAPARSCPAPRSP